MRAAAGVLVVALGIACSSTPTGKPRYGNVSFYLTTGATPQSSVDASFATTPQFYTVASDGSCVSQDIANDGYSAGEIDVSGTAEPIVFLPSGAAPNVIYQPTGHPPDPVFSGGAAIQVQAKGGPDVGPFNGSVTAPTDITGFTPPPALSRSGYTATWTSVAGATIEVGIAAVNSSQQGPGALLQCTVPDTGSFTVPASAFALIPANLNAAFVSVARVASVPIAVGDATITIQAVSEVDTGSLTLGP